MPNCAYFIPVFFAAVACAKAHQPLLQQKHRRGLSSVCGLDTLKGRYVWAAEGFAIVNNGVNSTDRHPIAYAGVEIYDGKGGLVGGYTGSQDGQVRRFLANSDTTF